MIKPIRMWALRTTLPAVCLFMSASLLGQQKDSPKPERVSCELVSVPANIQKSLNDEFGSWKVQEESNLSPNAHERWKSEKPLACPGIAVGRFENIKKPSYAFLLVPVGKADGGYKVLVFGPKLGKPSYDVKTVDSGDGGGANYFIHKVRISKFFDENSRKKFLVHTTEGILLVDSAENEYETDVYFWAKGRYQHQPVDY